ncbi:RNA polymerase sigma-70 factor (ECF subfamily) [Sporosarcina luteola]|nr:RNA polymerase sigma-70 factor (ECF subfamily) [Sporosarcina luteola]
MRTEFEEIYIEHSDSIYRFIYIYVRHHELAEDLTQETFYRAYKKIDDFKGEAGVSTWLRKIARNATYDYLRRKKIIQFFSFGKEDYIDFHTHSPETQYVKSEETRELYQAIVSMRKAYRDVLILRRLSENSIKETAYILGWTEAKVKSTMARAMKALKKEIGKLEVL